MRRNRTNRLMVAASLAAAAGLPVSLLAQEAPATPAGAEPLAAPALEPAREVDAMIRFNFKDAPFEMVLDFFSRESGLPRINEVAVPAGTMTFISGEGYTFSDALTILNLNLAPKGVQIRRERNFLYLGTLKDSARKASQVFHGTVPATVAPEQIANLMIPLSNARAETVAEQIKPLIGEYGSITPMPSQNMVLVVETAAQLRRIEQIVRSIDDVRPIDSSYRIFTLKYAKADAVFNALRGLVGQRKTTVIYDKDNKPRTLEEVDIAGLNLQPDPRTNSIIAVGPETRITVVEELVALLDVPDGTGAGGDRAMTTFVLEAIEAAQATTQLNSLFGSIEAARRPTIIAHPDAAKVTVVGSPPQLLQASSLLSALDPGIRPRGGEVAAPPEERSATTIRLKHITPAQIDSILPRLLSARQRSTVRFAPTADQRGLVVTGPSGDVEAFGTLVAGLDVPPQVLKDIRQVRISAGDPQQVLDRAQKLYEETGLDQNEPVRASVDVETRTITLIGGRGGLDRFSELLRSSESTMVFDLESRTFELGRTRPSTLSPRLSRILRPLLTGDDGSYLEPTLEPLDDLRTLIVRALPEQFAIIENMITRLDQEAPGSRQFQVLRVNSADPRGVIDRAMALYEQQTSGLPPEAAGLVECSFEAATGHALITASAEGMRLFGSILNQVQQIIPPARTMQVVDVRNVQANDIIGPLTEFLASADSIDPSREVPEPTIRIVEQSNSLLITAEDAQHRIIRDYITRLDRTDAALPPLRLLQLRTADAVAVSSMLSEQYSRRSQADRAAKPVEVRAEAATNTLIVAAHPDLFEEIRELVAELNRDKGEGTRTTEIFPLKVAKAVDVAAALEKLYPQPPMPVDRFNRPMPWAQQPREVTVSADPVGNTLMIYAPAEQMDSIRALAEKLDRVELPPQASLRTYRVVGNNLDAISRTLQGMATRGILSSPAQAGRASVQVMIDTEPRSSTLIVAGDDTTFDRVETMLRDLSAVPVEKGLRVVPIANVRAEDVRERALAIYDAQISQVPGANPVEVTVEVDTNSLMVVADGEAMQRFMKVIEELQRQAGPAREVRMIELRYAKAEYIKSFLDELVGSSESFRMRGGPDPVFEMIETSNALLVAAQPAHFAIIDSLVRNLDTQQATDRPPMRILRLRSTDADNLANVLRQSYDRRPQEQRARLPVDIQADNATNTLIVSAHPDVLPEIEQIVSQLNEQQAFDAEGREIRIFPLKIARAEELAKTIDAMYPEPPVPIDPRTRQPRPDLRLPKEVVVRADRQTNSLIVDAPARRLAGFEQIVRSLDQQKLTGDVELRTYRLRHADLNAAAAGIRSAASSGALYKGQSGSSTTITVDVEPVSRTIIVSGPSDIFAGVDEVLKTIETVPDRPTTGVKMYALRSARSERIQPLLQRVLLSRAREEQQAAGRPVDGIETLIDVSADTASNTLIISAPEGVLSIADALVTTLDQQSVAGGTELRVFRLSRGDSASVAKAVTASLAAENQGEPAASVTAEPTSNSIVMVGTQRQIEKAAALIEQLDVQVDVGGVGVRTVRLKHARAEAVAPVLETLLRKESLLSRLPQWQIGQILAQGGGRMGDEVRIAAERGINAVVISAPTSVIDMAEQVIAELDVDPAQQPGRLDRPVRIITLVNADATELAASIEAVVKDEQAGVEPPTVRVDRSSNSLIVRASAEQMTSIATLAERLDAATVASSRQMRMVPIDRSRADAGMMAETLRRIMEQQGSAKVEIISAEELMGGKPSAPDKKPPPDGPGRGDATGTSEGGAGHPLAVFPVLAALGVSPEMQPEQAAAPIAPITIAVEAGSNTLIFVGSPRLTDRLASLAAELERQMPSEPVRVRLVALPAALDAEHCAEVVRQTVRQLGSTSAQNPGGFTGAVSVAVDPSGGAMIVWANDTDFTTVGDLIRAVSQLETSKAYAVRVFPLSSLNATRAIAAINDLLSTSPRGRQAQRLRGSVDFVIESEEGQSQQGRLDPSLVRMTANPGGTAIIVAAPVETLPLIGSFIALLDQTPLVDRLAIRRYTLSNARAQEITSPVQQLLDAQRQGADRNEVPQARLVADARTNSLLVTATDQQHSEVTKLLEVLDEQVVEEGLALRVFTLQNTTPAAMRSVIDQIVIARNPALRERVQVSTPEGSSLLVVRAPEEQLAEIGDLLGHVDAADSGGLPVRFVKLERADATTVARALQEFFRDRATASGRSGQRQQSRVAITGDRRSGTLIVASSDDDFEQLKELVATFDAPAKARELQYKIIPLENARVTDVQDTLDKISWELQFERAGGFGGRRQQEGPPEDRLFIQINERINSVVLMGQGETLETMIRIIAELDRPQSEQTRMVLRAIPVNRGDLRALASMVTQITGTPGWNSWRGRDPDAVIAEVDASRRLLILIGKQPKVEQAAEYIKELETAGLGEHTLETIALRHAPAPRAAETLRRVFAERAAAAGLPPGQLVVVGSQDGNFLLISAEAEALTTARDLIALIDQPEHGKDRQVEIFTLRNREAVEITNLVRAQFPRAARSEAQVIVTAQPSTNSIIVSALADDQPQIEALIQQLDTPPSEDSARLITVNLKSAQADDVAAALRAALPEGLKVRITPVRRNNTLLLTGSDETIQVVMDQIAQIDVELERPLVELKRVQLKHAIASEVTYTITEMLRGRPRSASEPIPRIDYTRADNMLTYSGTVDQIRDIDRMVEALDVPSEVARTTEFIKLDFAKAEQAAKALEVFYGRFAPAASTPAARNVTIVPDPASNSLVVSADESVWEGLRSILKKLDTEEYDSSRQLEVIPLRHADARGLAQAINEGFRAPVQERLRRDQERQRQQSPRGRQDDVPLDPPILVDAEPTPTVSAETQTNSLVVFAGRQDMQRIRALVEQIDIPDFVKFPDVHIVTLSSGKASQIATSLRELYITQGQGRTAGPRAVTILGDDTSNSLIVRAEEREFAQIKALAEALQQEGEHAKATVRVLQLNNVPAARLQRTIAATFTQTARQHGEVLSVEVDRTSNALVIASSRRVYDEIERVVRELDGAPPLNGGDGVQVAPGAGLGQSVLIIDVQNNSPEDVRRQLEQLGVMRPPADDRPGIVSEAVIVVPLASRRAIAVVASPQDGETLVALVRALDAEPLHAEQKVATVALKLASAPALVQTLREMLNPANQASQTGPARAIAEQVRRLSIARNTIGQGDLVLDLSRPIRLIPDAPTNSVMIASTPENIAALREVITSLDTLPIGDAVVVRIFPLSNASAPRAKSVVEDLFRQGEALRRLPGTQRQGLPTTTTGRALAGEIAVSIDERTNTVIVAGREEAVALVEVLIRDLDGEHAAKWIEPVLIPLAHADATAMAAMLRQVLVQGLTAAPEAAGLQRQVGRLRMARNGRDMTDPAARLEADLFAPLTGLVITPEANLNSLIVVGSTGNIAIVRELVAMLDVEAASANNTVRIFALQHAAADRVSAMLIDLFRQRQQDPTFRPEDRLIITPDLRTNSLVIASSPRTFSIVEGLVSTLDSERTHATVSLHVVPVVGADATVIAPKISSLMRERIQATQRAGEMRSPTDIFSIEADAANNFLIVACSAENLQLVQDLVSALSQGNAALADAARTDLIQLRLGRAADIAGTLRQLYADKENAKRGARAVGVVPNERLNAIVVTGTEADLSEMRRIVDRLENAEVVIAQDIERIGLRSANALEVVTLLQNVLAGRNVSGGNDIAARQATNIRFFRDRLVKGVEEHIGRPPTEAQVDGAIREQVTLTPDLRTNSVVVKAPPAILAVIRDIIEDLDMTSAGARRIERFTLINADVRAMADLLRDIFTLRQQGSRYVLVPTFNAAGDDSGMGPMTPGGTVTPVPDERQELSIAIDARTNTLIVSGTEEYLDRVRQVVNDLDGIEATERLQRVYAVKNTLAADIERTLQAYFNNESARQRQLLGPDQSGSVLRQLEQEVTVVGDAISNKLVISTSPRYMDMVLKMIEELDAVPPQVVIHVLLAEVSIDNSSSWGADLRFRNVGGDNWNITSLAAGAGVAAALGVPNLTFASADFDLILRALEEKGRLQVLSRPHLQTRNNTLATLQVGDDIAVVRGVERLPQGGTRADVERQEIGIKLNVTPSISPDGFVRMEIAPEISTLSQRTTQISEDFFAPVINKRQISTTVTVRDGHTVVLGGLIQSTEEERRSKTPIIGDIPLLGQLFRSRQNNDVKTELLVILTPHVIYNDDSEGSDRTRRISTHKIDTLASPEKIWEAMKQDNDFNGPSEGEAPDNQPIWDRPLPPAAAPAYAPEPIRPEPSPRRHGFWGN
jgi:type II secretion system protein D